MPLNICGFPLIFSFSEFQLLYAGIASFVWLCALLFSAEYMACSERKMRYYVFMLLTYAATIGIFFSADLLTTFLFFEMMSFTSYVLVIQEETPKAMDAGQTYLAIAVIAGMVMLMGLFLLYGALGSLRFNELYSLSRAYPDKERLFIAGGLIFIGFAAKAGIFPLHIWMPKAYPASPAPVAAISSGILIKAGIFGIIVLSSRVFFEDVAWGTVLLAFATITMLLGAVLALFSINLNRTLACSSISQIGFITLGIAMISIMGEHNPLAARGTILHMVNHSMIKLLLFLAAGVIYMKLKKLDLNEIRGYGRNKPLLKSLFLLGALSMGGIPLTSGYISKTLLHESIVEYINEGVHLGHNMFTFHVVEWLFLISGALTVAYMTKLFVCIFVERNENSELQANYESKGTPYLSRLSAISICIPFSVILFLGLFPYLTMDRIADFSVSFLSEHALAHQIHYFTPKNLSGSIISIFLGAIIYIIIRRTLTENIGEGRRRYVNLWPKPFDLEQSFFRPVISLVVRISYSVCTVLSSAWDTAVAAFLIIGGFSALLSIGDKAVWATLIMGGFSAKATNMFGDNVISRMQRNLFRQINPHEERFTPLDWVKKHPLSDKWSKIRDSALTLSESMSFGLLATVIGLCAVLLYLL
ncbi:MAG: sodium:proton antiporter [Clostridia bacterium]|nr:sodium:proton antiporter [Clostridia bacterium]